jgi:peptidoglycan/xylan/chitin deacetylase (PgdA/CDA1 family)
MYQPRRTKDCVLALRRGLQALQKRRARILAYHSVSDQRTDCWSVSCRQFESHLQLLRANDMTVVGLSELVRRMQRGMGLKRLVAITFDDGYCDFLEYAAPVLRHYGLSATVFVPVAMIGGVSGWSRAVSDAPIMNVGQLEQVLKEGFAIGSHTMTHRRLPMLADTDLREEIDGSLQWLQARLGVNWMSFAYPFGDFGPRECLAVQSVGYHCAAGFGGLWGNGPETDPFGLNRDAIKRACDGCAFQRLLSGWNDWIVAARLLGHRWFGIPYAD